MSARAERRIRRREERQRRRAFRRALKHSPWMDISPEAPWFAAVVAWIAFRFVGGKPRMIRVRVTPAPQDDEKP